MEDRPFDRLTVSEISSAAGISVGNFYNRFPDKQSLLLALYQSYEAERTETVLRGLDDDQWSGLDLTATVLRAVDHLVDFYFDRRHLIRSYVLHFRSHPEEASAEGLLGLTEIARSFVSLFAQAAERDGSPLSPGQDTTAYQMILALSREFVLFSDDPFKGSFALDQDAVKREVAAAVVGYLHQ